MRARRTTALGLLCLLVLVAPADEIRRGVENVLYDVFVSGRSWEW